MYISIYIKYSNNVASIQSALYRIKHLFTIRIRNILLNIVSYTICACEQFWEISQELPAIAFRHVFIPSALISFVRMRLASRSFATLRYAIWRKSAKCTILVYSRDVYRLRVCWRNLHHFISEDISTFYMVSLSLFLGCTRDYDKCSKYRSQSRKMI